MQVASPDERPIRGAGETKTFEQLLEERLKQEGEKVDILRIIQSPDSSVTEHIKRLLNQNYYIKSKVEYLLTSSP